VYAREKAEQAQKNFFREQILVALRELALRQAAHEVEQRIENGETRVEEEQETREQAAKYHKILVLVTADPEAAALIRRAKRMADFLNAECFAVAVQPAGDLSNLQVADRDAIERHLNFARNLHIETRVVEGGDTAAALVEFARRNQVTQIFVARPREKSRWLPVASKNIVQRIVGLAKDMQVVIVSNPERVLH
jgi:two-component system sensor histidine kinase KdpD